MTTNVNQVKTLRLLTYNVGLLDFKLFGAITVFSNPPYSDNRLPYIPDILKHENADICVLQECYNDTHANYLITNLMAIYPYHARKHSGGCLKFHNGLLILSKWPITNSELIPYNQVAVLESYLATKSFLLATINIPSLGNVSIANIHTTAGGSADPEDPSVDKLRQSELDQSFDCLKALENNGHGVILMGDYNCGPEASISNYNYVLNNKYRDLFKEAVDNNFVSDSGEIFSWHPDNFLNKSGPHSHSCPQRVDHIMVPSQNEFWDKWVVTNGKIAFKETVVPLKQGVLSTISDHYGVVVDIAIVK